LKGLHLFKLKKSFIKNNFVLSIRAYRIFYFQYIFIFNTQTIDIF